MENELEELGPVGTQVRATLFGHKSDAQLREQLRLLTPGSDGANMVRDELRRRQAELPEREAGLAGFLKRLFTR